MCYVWQKQKNSEELSLEQIEKIFSEKSISSNLEIINLTGGEPTLRTDLTEIVRILLKYCGKLKRIDIPTNGINTLQILDRLEQISVSLLPTDVKLNITVSLDGIGAIHEKIRGKQNIFKNVDRTVQGLKELRTLYPILSLGINTVVNKINYKYLQENRSYALANDIGINFTLAAISEIGVESIETKEKFLMNDQEKREVIPFFNELLESGELKPSYGRFIIDLLKTGRRNNGCAFRKAKALLLEPNGNVYLCGNFKKFILGNINQNSFSEIRYRKVFGDEDRRVCKICASNCYWDEA